MASPAVWIALLAVMNLFWAGSYSVMKYGLASLDPLSLVFWRLFIGFIILACWIAIRRYDLRIGWRDGLRVASSGIFIALSSYLTVIGVEMSHASDASLLYVFEPVWAIILACIFLKERMLISTILGLVIAIAGLVKLSGFEITAGGFLDSGVGLGNALIVIGLMAEGLFSIMLKPASKRRPAVVLFAGVLLTATLVLSIPMYLKNGFGLAVDRAGIFSIGYLAVICTALGYTVWVAVLRHVPLSVMEFTIFIQPIAGMLIATATLGEPIDGRVFWGGTLCIAGMAVAVAGHIRHAKHSGGVLASKDLVTPADAL